MNNASRHEQRRSAWTAPLGMNVAARHERRPSAWTAWIQRRRGIVWEGCTRSRWYESAPGLVMVRVAGGDVECNKNWKSTLPSLIRFELIACDEIFLWRSEYRSGKKNIKYFLFDPKEVWFPWRKQWLLWVNPLSYVNLERFVYLNECEFFLMCIHNYSRRHVWIWIGEL